MIVHIPILTGNMEGYCLFVRNGIQNFRDLGGYESANTGKSLRWGMIYRSAQIDSIPPCSRRELKNMGVRTIIDLRSENERHNYPQLHDNESQPDNEYGREEQ